jgi:hypothetical protein
MRKPTESVPNKEVSDVEDFPEEPDIDYQKQKDQKGVNRVIFLIQISYRI